MDNENDSSRTLTIQIAKRGQITLPHKTRKKYNLEDGNQLTLINLDGAMLLIPKESEVQKISNFLRVSLERSGESLESMLKSLRKKRERN